MKNWMKSFFFWTKKNAKLKHIEYKKPRERYQANIILFETISEIDLNIFLQWWIVSQSMGG